MTAEVHLPWGPRWGLCFISGRATEIHQLSVSSCTNIQHNHTVYTCPCMHMVLYDLCTFPHALLKYIWYRFTVGALTMINKIHMCKPSRQIRMLTICRRGSRMASLSHVSSMGCSCRSMFEYLK